ncbi:HlyD family efflux transporter periplasmic adaptor subunit [Sedimentibacter sp.]|uniref:efflux RND transporter periplasmic adaptor subunit n=1 Tax=Sedimentibacter sp. TaxID=1960295 RepID=UPI0028A80260|nr:HlyD family efflux transporter periplasmic adaptor subunit [Sedimentibacter sp.]
MTYDCKENEKNKKQKIYAKALAGFFVLMLLFTTLSRAADSVAVAKVYAKKAERGRLSHETLCEGWMEPREKLHISSEEGFIILEIKAEQGQSVTAGEPLIILDASDIEEQLSAAETELRLLELKKQSLSLNTYDSSGDRSVEKAEAELKRAQEDLELNKEINGGIKLEKDKRAVEDALLNLQAAIGEKEKAQAADKAAREKNEIDKESAELEIQLKNKEISSLRELAAVGSAIYAEISGTIDEIYVKSGEKTSGGNLISIIPGNSKYYFKAVTDKEDAKYIKQGDSVEVTLEGQKAPIKDVEVKWVKLSTSDKNTVEIAVEMPENNELYNGMAASVKHVKITEEYSKVVPLSAVRSSGTGNYVLGIKNVNTLLGEENAAYRINIEVLDNDGSKAAVSGLSNEDVIVNSNKPIEESDRVRVKTK